MPNPGFVPLSADTDAEEGNEVIDNVTRAEFEDTQRENREFRRRIMEYENERRDMQRAASNSPTNNGGEGSSNLANSPGIGQAEDAPLDGSGQAGAGGIATRNDGVAAATMLTPVPSVIRVEPNRNAIQNAVKLAHKRGVILDLQQLSSMQLTWAHRYAAALAGVPDIHNGFKGAARRAVEIMYFETPDVDHEYWTPWDTNITALCTAIGITDADYVAKVRLVMENEKTRPSHLRKQQQDARNKVHTMGRVMLYERFHIRIARPDRGPCASFSPAPHSLVPPPFPFPQQAHLQANWRAPAIAVGFTARAVCVVLTSPSLPCAPTFPFQQAHLQANWRAPAIAVAGAPAGKLEGTCHCRGFHSKGRVRRSNQPLPPLCPHPPFQQAHLQANWRAPAIAVGFTARAVCVVLTSPSLPCAPTPPSSRRTCRQTAVHMPFLRDQALVPRSHQPLTPLRTPPFPFPQVHLSPNCSAPANVA
ncbi:unnamed protein product [Closterium sp. Naga37s-1]|nr:unnamed protein product [Closterium sp. Naga37s-1]